MIKCKLNRLWKAKKKHKDAKKNQEYMTLHTTVILSETYPSKTVASLLSMYSLFTCISSILLPDSKVMITRRN